MAITKEQAIDILELFDFLQGQRAGRELWNDKPFEVQERDIRNFSNNVALLKEYIADVVPKSEVEKMKIILATYGLQDRMRVAREIFAEIEKTLIKSSTLPDCARLADLDKITELKKKYTGEQSDG